jgi:hypothetical protein
LAPNYRSGRETCDRVFRQWTKWTAMNCLLSGSITVSLLFVLLDKP